MISFGFIGCGNMGGTLACAVSKAVGDLAVSDRSLAIAKAIAGRTGAVLSTNEDIFRKAKYIVLGVKPQVLPDVLESMSPILHERKDRFVVICMAAGVEIAKITGALGMETPVIRIMPNTPAAIGEGMIVYSTNAEVTADEKSVFLDAFSAAGDLIEISESLIDAASAVSGCGPAYVYMFIEALADGGVRCGLSRDLAMRLAATTINGSANMVLQSGKHPGELKDAVCSPSGSTIEGVETLEKGAFRGTVSEAVTAAYKRTKELS